MKTNVFPPFLKLRFRFHVLTFATFGRPGAPPGTPFESFGALLGLLAPPWNLGTASLELLGFPEGPFRAALFGPRPNKTGLRQQRKTKSYRIKTLLLEKHGFESPPANDCYSFWALFWFSLRLLGFFFGSEGAVICLRRLSW